MHLKDLDLDGILSQPPIQQLYSTAAPPAKALCRHATRTGDIL